MKKLVVFLLGLLPLGWLLYRGIVGDLGPDPGKAIVLGTGIWSFHFLLITLAITPVSKFTGFGAIFSFRRMVGLYLWFYASVHFVAVWTYLLGWRWSTFVEEFSKRPYMAVGIIAWLLLLPLGVTSTRWAQRKLGRNWRRLHQLLYPASLLASIHFIWLVRSNYLEALVYCGLLVALLLMRLPLPAKLLARGVGR